MLKRTIKGLLILLGVLIVGFFILKWSFSEEIPRGESGAKADALAEQVLNALNATAMQKMDSISWTFRGVNHYTWRPIEASVTVTWDDFKVDLDTQNAASSPAFKNGEQLQGTEKQEAITYAEANFNNDSFWLVAPYKIMDPGTERERISENELLVRYVSGGTTPGDVYVWQLDNNQIPYFLQLNTYL